MTSLGKVIKMTKKIKNPDHRLFPGNLPEREWVEFEAAEFKKPVTGAVFTSANATCCGVPLGGISTGCLDLDVRGTFGFSSIFHPSSNHPTFESWRMPRKLPNLQPFLGLSTGGHTWVLSAPEIGGGQPLDWCTEPQMQEREGKTIKPYQVSTARLEEVAYPEKIELWGHYPVADLEYIMEAPLQVSLRAWAPFIPGDATASNIPAAVFEVHLRNPSKEEVECTLAFSFAGPDPVEARSSLFSHEEVNEDVLGVHVSSQAGVGYVLGVLDTARARTGISLGETKNAWSKIADEMPQPAWFESSGQHLSQQGSASLAIDLKLDAGETRIERFVLAWYAPEIEGVTHTWEGEETGYGGHMRLRWIGSEWQGRKHVFNEMYAARFSSALDVARFVAVERENLLARILAWQAAIYSHKSLPGWLQDALINNLALFAEDSHWFQARPPLAAELFPGGAFALNESPRGCPHMACTPCDWYGNLPVVYFFPELALSTLRMFKEYQLPNGEIPFALGKIADLPDMATPEYYWQVSLNGMCYIDLVDRLWQRTQERSVLAEFYPSVKKANEFLIGLAKGPGAAIRMPDIGGMEWFEFGEWAGMAAHLGGLRLAQLRMVIRMAQALGDRATIDRCQDWLDDGSQAMEEKLWTGSYYLNFSDPETGKISDDVMGYQLDGEWTARFHGLRGVFKPERLPVTLETIRRCNTTLTPKMGAANFARPDGAPLADGAQVAHYGQYSMFVPEILLLAMVYIQTGDGEYGLEMARKAWQVLCLERGHMWDLPNLVSGDDGRRLFGTDYYQDMMLWALPAAILEQDIADFCAANGLVAKVMKSGLGENWYADERG
jgi:uncharacterized protein (DUF608 family)